MRYKFLIDTYAWVEYFKGSLEGEKAKPYIEGGEALTSVFAMAELAEKYQRENKNLKEDVRFILSKTKVTEITLEIAQKAGELNAENKRNVKNWGMADSMMLATANAFGARVVTGDHHFKDTDAIMIA